MIIEQVIIEQAEREEVLKTLSELEWYRAVRIKCKIDKNRVSLGGVTMLSIYELLKRLEKEGKVEKIYSRKEGVFLYRKRQIEKR